MKYPNLTGKALINWIVANKSDLIEAKKATVKRAAAVAFNPVELMERTDANKARYLFEDNEDKGVLKRTIIANTYLWLDNHDDVHMEGLFANSIAQRSKRLPPHLHDHEFSVMAKVGKPISYSERKISWRELGLGKTGSTSALFLETEVLKDYNEKVYKEYLDGAIDQHSVGMRYIKLELAVNDEEEHPEEYKLWQEVLPKLGNRAEAEKRGFFFVVKEAALLETSAVLEGSNELTPTLGNKSEPSDDIEIKSEQEEDVEPQSALDVSKILSNYLNN